MEEDEEDDEDAYLKGVPSNRDVVDDKDDDIANDGNNKMTTK